MSTPQAKRRRLDAASSTLSKPFRSPFKTPLKTSSTTTPSQLSNQQNSATHHENESAATPSKPTNRPLHNLALPNRPSLPSPTSATKSTDPVRKTRPQVRYFSSPVATAKLNADPEVATLLKKQRALERELRDVREELDVMDQARKIEVQSEKRGGVRGEVDGELKGLIEKWRGASRGAAEELFGGVKDRVNRMGGPKAWKDMQKRQQEFQAGYDAEGVSAKKPNESDDESDSGDDEEERVAKRQRRDFRDKYGDEGDGEVETENEREQRGGNVIDGDDGADDEFTMAMMLKTLNIDPKMIGYDREGQRWID